MSPIPVQGLIIANPASGRGRARRIAGWALTQLRSAGWEVDLALTEGRGHARELAVAGLADGATRIIACGGDGTIAEVAGALAHRKAALGLLPAGRGNDLATALGVVANPATALAIILAGRERRIDLGVANGRHFCTVAGVGFDAFVNHRVSTGLWRLAGAWSYTLGVLAYLYRYQAPRATLRGAFGVLECSCFVAAVGNTGIYGGGIPITPGARVDDGQLDLCLVRDGPRLQMLRVFMAAFSGRHVFRQEVETMRTATLTIETDAVTPVVLDGETTGTTPVTFGVDPLALRVLVPG